MNGWGTCHCADTNGVALVFQQAVSPWTLSGWALEKRAHVSRACALNCMMARAPKRKPARLASNQGHIPSKTVFKDSLLADRTVCLNSSKFARHALSNERSHSSERSSTDGTILGTALVGLSSQLSGTVVVAM